MFEQKIKYINVNPFRESIFSIELNNLRDFSLRHILLCKGVLNRGSEPKLHLKLCSVITKTDLLNE